MLRTTLGLVAACLLCASCKASVNADAEASLSAEGEADRPSPAPAERAALAESEEEDELGAGREPALLGARHDLRLAASQTSARCSCLAVALGAPTDPAFQWRGEPAQIDPASQLVIALGSEGVACQAAPAGGLGASYWGYRQKGADVEVVVETARAGRPLTRGAIIPRPPGQVVIVPLDGSVPYGRGADSPVCRLDVR